jgi:biotin-(acetyl-CoA carboxylase) ligase
VDGYTEAPTGSPAAGKPLIGDLSFANGRSHVTALREYHEQLPSTQERAIELARSGAPVGTRVVAVRQTRGIGRLDHRWESPPGGLYVSMLEPSGPTESSLLPLAIASAVADACERSWAVRPRLKWPNDLIQVGPPGPSRKLGGVIVDRIERAGGERVAVVGVGINVRTPAEGWPATQPLAAVALDALAPPGPEVAEVEVVVAAAVDEAAADLDTSAGRRAAVERCRRLLWGVGESALVDGQPAGRIRRLADDGALELDRDGEPMTIRSGDLTVLSP